ncbi:MAG: PEP-CTERM sorting domain-containing protein [Planctomycetota bacterium]|nr:MAG: PEP-CTERM sorting domain-containing protein [Planctomycetota bacterium]
MSRSILGLRCTIISSLAVALLAAALPNNTEAVTYDPGDPSMAYITLTTAPVQLGPGDDHPGMWEYVYDVMHAVGTWERNVYLKGLEADSIANLHDIGSGPRLYHRWGSHSAGGWILWGGFWNKQILPSYSDEGAPGGGGLFNLWELPSEGACVGCVNEAYEYYNEWHTPFDYNTQIFYGGSSGALLDLDAGVTGNDAVHFYNANATAPNAFNIGGLGYTFRVVHPNAPGTIGWEVQGIVGEVVGPAPVSGPTSCLIGDVNCDGFVEIGNDILVAFTNFTGPGSFGKDRSTGDVHGPAAATTDPLGHDGDVDVSDILTIFGAFTGPPPDEGSGGLGGPAEAGDPSIPDLIYDAATGEVTLDADGSSIIGYSLQNATNSFLPAGHTPILAGVTTALTSQLEEAALAPGSGSIGLVFPTGLDLAGLQALLTVNTVSRFLGAPLVPFDLVVVSTSAPPIPEPATAVLSLVGLMGLGLMAWRRRRIEEACTDCG